MNDDNQTETAATTDQQLAPLDPDFYSIDGPVMDWSQRFPIAMLRVGRLLLKNGSEVMGVSETRVSKLMAKHRNEIPEYGPLQIREELHKWGGEIRGGGIKIEWAENLHKPYRSVPHFDFTFSRILRPEDYKKPEPQHERDRT
jgi:hypothetical protein